MDASLFWIGIVPVIAFVVLDSFTSKRAAIISAMALAAAECVFSIVSFGSLDELTVFSFSLVIVMGVFSIKTKNDLFFKLQPAILGLFFAGSFFFFYFILDKPLLTFMAEKYLGAQIDVLIRGKVSREVFERMMTLLSRDLGWWIFGHAALTAYAALRLSKWWGLVIRVPMFYVILFIGMYVELAGFKA